MSAWAINSPIPTIVLFLILTLAGVYSYTTLRINSTPDIDVPSVTISVAQTGASPTELETQVTRIIENAVAGLNAVDAVTSSISEGNSTTTVEFAFGTDIDRATNDVRNAVTSVQSQLPAAATSPTVERVEISGNSILTFVVAAPAMSPEQLSWFVDNPLADAITTVSGVGSVDRSGGVDRLIRVELDPGTLAALGVTAADVSQQLQSVNIDRPGGRVTLHDTEQTIRTVGNAVDLEGLANTIIRLPNGVEVRLADLGSIADTWAEPRQLARLDGSEVVAINVYRSPGSSELRTTERVRHTVEELDQSNPDVEITEVTSSSDFVEESVEAALESLLLGAALAVAIVYLFLRDIRATMVSAVAIPLSLIPTFLVMAWLDLSLNTITLLALSLVVGILVDDAIVEIENIVRHMRQSGEGPKASALKAADEIGLAVVATTATLIAVFGPVAFMPGTAGQFFMSFGIVTAVAVFFSLVVARLVTPLMSAYLVKAKGHVEDTPFWMPTYLWLLRLTLRFRWLTLIVFVAMFIGALALATQLKTEFLPSSDRGQIILSVELPPGSSLQQTDAAIAAVREIFMDAPEIKSIYATVGTAVSGGGFGPTTSQSQVNSGRVTITLEPRNERARSQQELEADFARALIAVPGARVGYSGGFAGTSVSVTLVGDDAQLLATTRDQLRREMAGIAGLRNVNSTASLVRPELVVRPDQDRAAMLGITASQIAEALNTSMLGDSDANLTKMNLGDRQVSIRVALAEGAVETIDDLAALPIRGSAGTVPLGAVAHISFEAGPSSISRVERQQSAGIDAELGGLSLGEAEQQIAQLPTMRNLPAGIERLRQGESEQIAELFGGFIVVFGAAVLFMYMTLVLLFRGFFQPLTILTALPLSIGGALGLLFLTGNAIGVTTLIGILMLMGIAAKNSILLVEYALVAQARGVERVAALLDAAEKRARPILMTSIAMGAGMLPIALGWGADAETRAPLAIAVIGGLVSSTLLSLVFVPVAYTLLQDLEQAIGNLLSRLLVDQNPPSTQPEPSPK
jgi:HAE1 family hydrophobic/amphiphilic exporter-1